MVVRISLTVKNIKGQQFTVDVDRSADTLGLKVLIWEEQNIPVENQRLVFAGRELQDDATLSNAGIEDGAVIFLVETNQQNAQQNIQAFNQQPVVEAYAPIMPQSVSINHGNQSFEGGVPIAVSVPPSAMGIQNNRNQYQPVDASSVREINVGKILDLAFWVRLYCWIGAVLSVISIFACWFSCVPLAFFIIGIIGTRKLNSCCLAFPLLTTMILCFASIAGPIFAMAKRHHHFQWFMGVSFFVGLLLFCIVTCICKLMCLINRSTPNELSQTRERIQSRGRCC